MNEICIFMEVSPFKLQWNPNLGIKKTYCMFVLNLLTLHVLYKIVGEGSYLLFNLFSPNYGFVSFFSDLLSLWLSWVPGK